ncbi:MAG: hydrolase [Gemmatimonadetes bacterium]|nr:hydrolase [Gemmatimonadota bacterium]
MTAPKQGPKVVTSEDLRATKRATITDAQVDTIEVYAGKIFTLNRDTVRFPDGSTGELHIARHPGASAVIPFLSGPLGDEPQVLMIRQYRYAVGGYIYEIPAGRLDCDETPMECAARELKEETGCTADHIEPLTSMLTTPGFTDEVIHLFMATGLTHGEPNREADEFVELVVMRLSEALEKISTGEIIDGKTALALLFAAGFKT